MRDKSPIGYFLSDLKAKAPALKAFFVAVLMIAASASVVMLSSPVSAASAVFSDNFEDADWSNWDDVNQNGNAVIEQDTVIYNNGSSSTRINDTDAANGAYLQENGLNNDLTFSAEFYLYMDNTNIDDGEFALIQLGPSALSDDKVFVKVTWDATNGHWSFRFTNKSGGTTQTTLYENTTIKNNTWHRIRFSGNGSDCTAWINDTQVGSLGMSGSPYNTTQFRTMSGDTLEFNIDDFYFYNTSAAWGDGGSSVPSPPSSQSASEYHNFSVSVSGLDGDSQFQLPSASVNDTSGATVWSNQTSYGNLTVSNDGTLQINLSWTNDGDADRTIIEYDTSDHSPWNKGDGTEFYNETTGTGSSTVFDSSDYGGLSAEQTVYFAFFSQNTSGLSDSSTTASATTGNVSVAYINLTIMDVGNTTALLPKENITLYHNGSGSFASAGAFDATGGYVNVTTSAAGLPFGIGSSVTFRLKAVWGAGQHPSGTYYDNDSSSLDCSGKAGR